MRAINILNMQGSRQRKRIRFPRRKHTLSRSCSDRTCRVLILKTRDAYYKSLCIFIFTHKKVEQYITLIYI